ncbi:MAG: alpha/beta hydrolase [Chloroflexota bacterium]
MKNRQKRARFVAILLIVWFISILGILWGETRSVALADDNDDSQVDTIWYFPAFMCMGCPPLISSTTPTATPTPTVTLTPTPTVTATPTPTVTVTPTPTVTATPTTTQGILVPSLSPMYQVMSTTVQFGTAALISGTANITNPQTFDIPLNLDLYEPVNAPDGKRPVVMWMFGSGFVSVTSNRAGKFVPIAQELASRGYVVVAIDYRTSYFNPVISANAQPYHDLVVQTDHSWVPFVFTDPPLSEEQYERGIAAAYDDGLTALEWLESEAASRSLDMDRVALMGSSSGTTTGNALAYLSDDLGITTPKITTMLHLWGSMDYSRSDGLDEIEADEANLFMIHSINDESIAFANASEMAAQAAAVGLPYELIALGPDPDGITPELMAGTGHGLTTLPILEAKAIGDSQTLFERLVEFLNASIDQERLEPSLVPVYEVMTSTVQFGTADLISGTANVTNPETISLPLNLDIYEPTNPPSGKRPVVMWMTGSGFVNPNATRAGNFVPIGTELASRGYMVFAIDYRTAYFNPVVSAQAQPYLDLVRLTDFAGIELLFPGINEEQFERAIAAAYDDGLTALKWLSSQAVGRSLDMSRIALMGSSSGTTTENALAYLSDDLGITTPQIAVMLHLWGGLEYSRFDGLDEIEADEAHLLMIHSENDGSVPFVNASEMAAQAANVGLPYELIALGPDPDGITPELMAGTAHGLTTLPILEAKAAGDDQTLFERLVAFLTANLPSE